MSYDILYDRLYIKAGDNLYMPVIQSGSNNCFEYSWRGREIPEKNWSNLEGTGSQRTRKLFRTKEELAELGKEIGDINREYGDSGLWKTRNKVWDAKALESFIANGWKEAMTVEEYKKNGAYACVRYYFYEPASDKTKFGHAYLETTEQLLSFEAYALGKAREEYPDVAMRGFTAYVSFTTREAKKYVKMKTKKERKPRKKPTDDYYIIGNPAKRNYYVKRSSRRLWSTIYQEYAHRYATLAQAERVKENVGMKQLGYTAIFHAINGEYIPVTVSNEKTA